MIFLPPTRFDSNEWFIIFGSIIPIMVAILVPKRFPSLLTTYILTFNIYLSHTVDFLIGFPPYDLYDVNDSPQYEYMDFILYTLSYPPFTYLFLYFYDKWKWKGYRLNLYILGSSLFTTMLEWVAHLFHVYTYKGWQISYSFFVYLGVFSINILLFHLVQNWLSKNKEVLCVKSEEE